MEQCRCPSENKEIRYDVCDNCKNDGDKIDESELKRTAFSTPQTPTNLEE